MISGERPPAGARPRKKSPGRIVGAAAALLPAASCRCQHEGHRSVRPVPRGKGRSLTAFLAGGSPSSRRPYPGWTQRTGSTAISRIGCSFTATSSRRCRPRWITRASVASTPPGQPPLPPAPFILSRSLALSSRCIVGALPGPPPSIQKGRPAVWFDLALRGKSEGRVLTGASRELSCLCDLALRL